MGLNLVKIAHHGVLDYSLLMSYLQGYKAPHRKINTLLSSGQIIRIKKGLYILGDVYRIEPVNRELVANLIYGPSYVSQEYALQYYGLIPERVETVSCMTSKRHKNFMTPLGQFTYTYINLQRYTVGIDWISVREDTKVLMASPEKALVDTIQKYSDIKTIAEMEMLIYENLRINSEQLAQLDFKRLEKITTVYRKPVATLLYRTLIRSL